MAQREELSVTRLEFGSNPAGKVPTLTCGNGVPAADEPIGSLYANLAGGATTTLYVKTAAGAGAANWTAK
jgi:hypothetical protein